MKRLITQEFSEKALIWLRNIKKLLEKLLNQATKLSNYCIIGSKSIISVPTSSSERIPIDPL